MRKYSLFLFIICQHVLVAQPTKTFDTSIVNHSFDDFFRRNPNVDSIGSNDGFRQFKRVSLYLKSPVHADTTKQNTLTKRDYFNLDYPGDKYRFAREYGELPIIEERPGLTKELVGNDSCQRSCFTKMYISPGSLRYLVTCYCPVKEGDDYDKIFTKVEKGPRYKSGDSYLQKEIQDAFKQNYKQEFGTEIDSVLFFKVVVDRKDSCLRNVELAEGKNSQFAQLVIDRLKTACGWIAGYAGGRQVMAYYEVFVRLNKDGSITVATPRW